MKLTPHPTLDIYKASLVSNEWYLLNICGGLIPNFVYYKAPKCFTFSPLKINIDRSQQRIGSGNSLEYTHVITQDLPNRPPLPI